MLVRLDAIIAEFVAKPSNCPRNMRCIPWAPPHSIASIAVPQKIPNAVRNVRILLRARVAVISFQLSMSNIGFFIVVV